ncbi:CCA tRNA nucleotidyltransferase [archaeon]|nr:CCA tRNA nucleotidyltransferase [archaeon]|tara:strand:- start:14149 stop:15378 length:1230 start_codon:yes stop_codon:yes gene_type:complete
MKILQEIKPSEKEIEKSNKVLISLVKDLKQNLKNCSIVIGGSFAKDTWLSGNHDIDLFIKFNYLKFKDKDISEFLKNNLKKIKYKIVHGSRDYLQVKKKGFQFELIPVLDIKTISQAKNITDLSPFHTTWVKKNVKNTDEIRIAKKFFKENELYGAETHLKGFSGYTIEILVAHYKSFYNLIKSASQWKKNEFIDTKKYYKNKVLGLKNINKARLSTLIVIDPIQKERNTSAALSNKNYNKFIQLSKDYLRNPNEDFFKSKKINFKLIKENYKDSKIARLKIKSLKEKEDIAGAKILKVQNHIYKKLKNEGFTVHDHDISWNGKIVSYFIIKDEVLPDYKKHYGPPIKENKHLELFKQKWKDYKLKNEGPRVYIEIKRKHKKLKSFLKNLLKKDSIIKNNVRKIRLKLL